MAGYRVAKSTVFIMQACLAVLLFTTVSAEKAHASCQLQQGAELHVTVDRHRALVPVEINGRRVQMIFDTGAGSSMLFSEPARRLALPTHYLSGALRVYGVGGESHPQVANIATLKLGENYAAKNLLMIVTGGRTFDNDEVVGLLGQDMFGGWDIEIDLAHSVIRLLRPVDCKSDQMVYWGAAYAQAPIQSDPSLFAHTTVLARLNGKSVEAYMDTGAQRSVVTLAAAAEAGVTPTSPKVRQTGISHGIGDYAEPTWTAVFDSFSLGEETINNAKIRMSDMFAHASHEQTGSHISASEQNLPGMLLGADFFLAHHVLISNSHHLVYFSYNGGPVFDISAPSQPALPTPGTAGATPAAGATQSPHVAQSDGHGD